MTTVKIESVEQMCRAFLCDRPEGREIAERFSRNGVPPGFVVYLMIKSAPPSCAAGVAYLKANREEAERCIAGILGYA